MSSPNGPSTPLDRFSPDVRAAFDRFKSTGDSQALELVVTAVVASFIPTPARGEPVPQVAVDKALIADLGFDSVAIAETVFFFEDLFGVSISNKDLISLRTVRDLCTYIEGRAASVPGRS